jgi:small subunit ribosomal protein S4e
MSRHLKSYAAPKSWTLLRKIHKWILRPMHGKHPLEQSLPAGLLLKQLGTAQTTREAKKIVNSKAVIVDGKAITNVHQSVGFMDSIQIKPNIALRCTLDEKGRLKFNSIPASELDKKICRITGKRTVKGGKIQLNLSDGRNILSDKKEYKVGDSVLIELPSQKIAGHFELAKGNTAFLTSGKHTGTTGTIEDIQGERIWCTAGKEKIETLKQFAFVIGKDKPALKL